MKLGSFRELEPQLESMTEEYLGESSKPIELEPLLPDQGEQTAYPTAMLGKTMAGAVQGIATLAAVPEALAAQSVLAACSLAVQGHFDVMLPIGHPTPLSLFLISVARSGDRKSTSDRMAMEAIREFEDELEQQRIADYAETSIMQSAWDEAKKHATATYKKQGREALAEAYRNLGPRPEGPRASKIVVKPSSTQGLVKYFANSRPSLGLMTDEGATYLGGYGMSQEQRIASTATLSLFWDGSPVQAMTAGDGHLILRDKRLSFHLMMQPMIANELWGDSRSQDQGFHSRLLVSAPQSLAGQRFLDPDAERDPEALEAVGHFKERLGRVVRAKMPVDLGTGLLKPEVLTLDDRARRMWIEFANDIESELGAEGKYRTVAGFAGKLPEMAARIAGVIKVFSEGVRATPIDGSTMLSGIEIAKFYLSEALRLFGKAPPSEEMKDAQDIVDWLRSNWDEEFVTTTIISKNGPTSLRGQGARIRRAIEVLEGFENYLSKATGTVKVRDRNVRTAWKVECRNG